MRPAARFALWLTVAASALVGPAVAQSTTRVVALVVTSDAQATDTTVVARSLQRVGAEILQVDNPSDSELRAVMRRFAQEAANSDASLVFIDLPVVSLDERAFVLQPGETLARATDLFTEAVPLRAFARMTALAERGGAVIVSAAAPEGPLPDNVVATQQAPEAVAGASEILFTPSENAADMLRVLDRFSLSPDSVDLTEIMRVAAARDEAITLSALPSEPILLTTPEAAEEIAPVAPEVSPDDNQLSAAELEILEQSLSPGARRKVQRALRSLGHYSGLIDGIIGDQTREAISAFQTAQASEATGFLTPRQFQELLAQQ